MPNFVVRSLAKKEKKTCKNNRFTKVQLQEGRACYIAGEESCVRGSGWVIVCLMAGRSGRHG